MDERNWTGILRRISTKIIITCVQTRGVRGVPQTYTHIQIHTRIHRHRHIYPGAITYTHIDAPTHNHTHAHTLTHTHLN